MGLGHGVIIAQHTTAIITTMRWQVIQVRLFGKNENPGRQQKQVAGIRKK